MFLRPVPGIAQTGLWLPEHRQVVLQRAGQRGTSLGKGHFTTPSWAFNTFKRCGHITGGSDPNPLPNLPFSFNEGEYAFSRVLVVLTVFFSGEKLCFGCCCFWFLSPLASVPEKRRFFQRPRPGAPHRAPSRSPMSRARSHWFCKDLCSVSLGWPRGEVLSPLETSHPWEIVSGSASTLVRGGQRRAHWSGAGSGSRAACGGRAGPRRRRKARPAALSSLVRGVEVWGQQPSHNQVPGGPALAPAF